MYQFAPLDRHYDKGFGAVADSFLDSASELKTQYSRAKLNGHLPICYLFRHAIELFLKGSIIIVHQALELPYENEPYTSEPKIPTVKKNQGNGYESIYVVHDIERLYLYLRNLLVKEKEKIDPLTRTDWELPAELSLKFKRIAEIDAFSTYFRYPSGKKSQNFEKEKSAFKESSIEAVMELAEKNKKPMKAMKVATLIGRETQVFVHDDSFTEDAMHLLSSVADEISALHFALMNELGQGGLA